MLPGVNCPGNRSRVNGVRNRLEIRALASQSPLPNSLPLRHSGTQHLPPGHPAQAHHGDCIAQLGLFRLENRFRRFVRGGGGWDSRAFV